MDQEQSCIKWYKTFVTGKAGTHTVTVESVPIEPTLVHIYLLHLHIYPKSYMRLISSRWGIIVTLKPPSLQHASSGGSSMPHNQGEKRRNHNFYTSRLPFRAQYDAEQKSTSQPKSRLTTRSGLCYFGPFVVPISYLSPWHFFKERVDFLETLPFFLQLPQCILAHRAEEPPPPPPPTPSSPHSNAVALAVTWERGKLRQRIRLRAAAVKRLHTDA